MAFRPESSRSSLARVSMGGANNRGSLAGRPSLAGAKRPSMAPGEDRRSRGPSMSGRRSSVAPGGGGRKQQDPRPISDKEYMKTSIHSVINYLTEHHYDRPIAPRVLSSPTTKDFVHILSFLLKAIDPNFKFGGKFEEEVPVIFKSLGYKITINKGPLQSVGAAHSWPQLLAALSWLVELLNYSDAVNGSEPGDGFEDNDDVSKIFFDYLARAYQLFLGGEDDTSPLEEQLAMIFEAKNASVKQDLETLTAANAELHEKLLGLTTGETPLEKQRSINAELLADEKKFKTHFEGLSEYRSKISASLAKAQTESTSQEAELAQLLQEIEAAKETISKQAYNPADVKRMRSEQDDLERELQLSKEQKDVHNQQLYDTSQKLNKKLEHLDACVQKANGCSVRLQMIPAEARHAGGESFQIELQKQLLSSRPEALLSVEPSAMLVPALQRLKAEVQVELSAAQDARLEAEECETKREEDALERKEALQALKTSLERLEKEEKLLREQLSRELEERNKEAEDLQGHILERRANGGGSVSESNRKIAALQKEYAEFRTTSHHEREKMYNDLVSALSMVTEHKELIQAQIVDLKDYCIGKTGLLQPLLAKD